MNDVLHWLICHGKMQWLRFHDPMTDYAQCERCGRIRANYYEGGIDPGYVGQHWINGSKGSPRLAKPSAPVEVESDEEMLKRIIVGSEKP